MQKSQMSTVFAFMSQTIRLKDRTKNLDFSLEKRPFKKFLDPPLSLD